MSYAVKEIFKTIQGEGHHAGRVAVFCRFAGCNLWSGREEDRADAKCKFCDTDFVGGMKYPTAADLAAAIETAWGPTLRGRMVVFTGGEPALQLDGELVHLLREKHFYTAMETNGTVALGAFPDWICISPKAGTDLKNSDADELKVVFPQPYLIPDDIKVYAGIKSIQPMDGPNKDANTAAAIAFCLEHPTWRLSLQTHKTIGVR